MKVKMKLSAIQNIEVTAVGIDGWMHDLLFYVLLNSVSVISGRWADDIERLCAMEPRLRLRRFCLKGGSNP